MSPVLPWTTRSKHWPDFSAGWINADKVGKCGPKSVSPFKKIVDGFCVLEPSIRKLLTKSSVDWIAIKQLGQLRIVRNKLWCLRGGITSASVHQITSVTSASVHQCGITSVTSASTAGPSSQRLWWIDKLLFFLTAFKELLWRLVHQKLVYGKPHIQIKVHFMVPWDLGPKI